MIDWFLQIKSKVYTIIKTRLTKKFKTKYKTLDFTMKDVLDIPARLPMVHIHELIGMESAQDLRSDFVSAVLETIQISVYSKTQDECEEILGEAALQMKRLRFEISAMPVYMSDRNIVQGIARFRKMIGCNDTLLK